MKLNGKLSGEIFYSGRAMPLVDMESRENNRGVAAASTPHLVHIITMTHVR